MPNSREHEFAELPVDRLILESFGNERSAYYISDRGAEPRPDIKKIRSRLKWHIDHSLSMRQKQVIKAYLKGRKERDTARVLGVTQQVVNIYKHRAIKKLHKLIVS